MSVTQLLAIAFVVGVLGVCVFVIASSVLSASEIRSRRSSGSVMEFRRFQK